MTATLQRILSPGLPSHHNNECNSRWTRKPVHTKFTESIEMIFRPRSSLQSHCDVDSRF